MRRGQWITITATLRAPRTARANNTMSLVYSNRLHTATQNIGDLYGSVTFAVDGSSFTPSEGFTWEMDADLVTPEGATSD
jgi:hypothetical protein